MRITLIIILIIIITRMIYDLTWNPVEAVTNMLGIPYATRKRVVRNLCILVIPLLIFAILWSLFVPKIIAYHGQKMYTETHVLKQMPMYSNEYIHLNGSLERGTYTFSPKNETYFLKTKKGVKVSFSPATTLEQTVVITYQLPKKKTAVYFFMDYLTWPKNKNEVNYLFNLTYE